ncbi:MAG: NUDIX hydrolase [Bacteroidetes bacterium]|nr:NUDIX hydrolase [Bacteroidota bacterium]
MNRQSLVAALQAYQTNYTEEREFVKSFLELLSDNDCYQRTHLPGHVTGSAWIVNADKTKTLLVHHGKLNRWMQPGGHADGDENILHVSLNEAEEETGLKNFILPDKIFDIDIHTIPARKDFPEHLHYDIRFLLIADEDEKVEVSEESHDVKWIELNDLEQLTSERSVLRMKEKLI